MSDDSILPPSSKITLGDRMRDVITRLRAEGAVQVKATSRILGAAAKLAENHDCLIDEVVDMVQDDLVQNDKVTSLDGYTVEKLKQQFKKFTDAKAHFDLKASSWQALVDKLNSQAAATSLHSPLTPDSQSHQASVSQRLELLERDVQNMRNDLIQVMKLLEELINKGH